MKGLRSDANFPISCGPKRQTHHILCTWYSWLTWLWFRNLSSLSGLGCRRTTFWFCPPQMLPSTHYCSRCRKIFARAFEEIASSFQQRPSNDWRLRIRRVHTPQQRNWAIARLEQDIPAPSPPYSDGLSLSLDMKMVSRMVWLQRKERQHKNWRCQDSAPGEEWYLVSLKPPFRRYSWLLDAIGFWAQRPFMQQSVISGTTQLLPWKWFTLKAIKGRFWKPPMCPVWKKVKQKYAHLQVLLTYIGYVLSL